MDSVFTHRVSMSIALAMHASIAAIALRPSDPIAIPQQQVIAVAMISSPTPEESEPLPEPDSLSPKAPEIKKPPKPKKPPQPEHQTKNDAPRSTSGPQMADAQNTNAALTQPMLDAAYLNNPAPAYPQEARVQHIEGTVLLSVAVSKNGVAEHVRIAHSSGSSVLDNAARNAVEHWRFIPAQRAGEAVGAEVMIPVIFKIG